ncbi:5'-methylthioadenosine/adenosylhomocysteine nucleosidase [Anaerocolumna xylanovorans]|uniref:adenosylhomocysteine nucleosidase n=1 Tax=Anaerocolumna xylanovorans DSM 12503 TaxID=1121345 RepID=A0A1M7YMK1_9FIRM|nr:5'-methylthioadenosine/adenosylhomocysteine nucleosidase [Anaerocolumna xylanovorans]SHO53844.1 adenosylhomocysteine nucleosidase [Anaerocolumna xylanovorans DSM 12503]
MKKTGIIGAMEEEVNQLKEKMEGVSRKEKAGMEFLEGTLEGRPCVVVRSGIGKVNAAVCTQILIDDYGVDVVINTGVAGSLKAEINIGDMVISEDALQHDVDATGFGYDYGVIPRMKTSVFKTEDTLTALAVKVCKEVNPDIGVFPGRIVSGDQFISDREKKIWIKEHFHGLCTEMEGGAIAQTAHLNKIPFLIIRAISDKADDSAHMDYGAFEAKAIEHTVKLVKTLLKAL